MTSDPTSNIQDPRSNIIHFSTGAPQSVDSVIDFRFGYVSDDQVSDLLARHHLVVQPYRSASQSGVIPLAFAAGRGVVVTPVGGLSEVVEPDRNGVIAKDISAESLAAAIA